MLQAIIPIRISEKLTNSFKLSAPLSYVVPSYRSQMTFGHLFLRVLAQHSANTQAIYQRITLVWLLVERTGASWHIYCVNRAEPRRAEPNKTECVVNNTTTWYVGYILISLYFIFYIYLIPETSHSRQQSWLHRVVTLLLLCGLVVRLCLGFALPLAWSALRRITFEYCSSLLFSVGRRFRCQQFFEFIDVTVTLRVNN